jgi:hypothetical protein
MQNETPSDLDQPFRVAFIYFFLLAESGRFMAIRFCNTGAKSFPSCNVKNTFIYHVPIMPGPPVSLDLARPDSMEGKKLAKKSPY